MEKRPSIIYVSDEELSDCESEEQQQTVDELHQSYKSLLLDTVFADDRVITQSEVSAFLRDTYFADDREIT